MKDTIKLFGVIALVAVIGFMFGACGGDDDDGGGSGGGGDPIKAKFVGTEWRKGTCKITFVEVTSGGMAGQGFVNLNYGENDGITGYALITKFETDKFICYNRSNIPYVLSSDGRTLTITTIGDYFNGEYTKVP
jgi:hypothetical protein